MEHPNAKKYHICLCRDCESGTGRKKYVAETLQNYPREKPSGPQKEKSEFELVTKIQEEKIQNSREQRKHYR